VGDVVLQVGIRNRRGLGSGDDEVGAGSKVEFSENGTEPTPKTVAHDCDPDPAAHGERRSSSFGRLRLHERDHCDRA
jgi:hypothetical protein